ncbi:MULTISPECIES: IucA/IucC family protein [unclassified Methylobacterium]|jgi:N2-citryl-N6-acetyl-N6-hydroxylysine synthase|uniref:IucA/IucC family protein n=1 Tax=unclassified Methylobacterium TaxID=2615210 RepID=UPI001353EF3C|nr:IucA/IucC family protein [Methylobacterium sp. 2A]MWV22403.1 IucA/IucC family siderophore biosynthesis protein [Methylobacterium sp. 2A]
MVEAGIFLADVACEISARGFLNALLREWRGWSLVPATEVDPDAGPGARRLRIPLPSRGSVVEIALVHVSAVGLHVFRLPFREYRAGAPARIMAFPDFAAAIAYEPEIVGPEAARAAPAFLGRVFQSLAAIEDLLARAPSSGLGRHGDPSFRDAERALRFGHAVHPTPRSRDAFTLEEARSFAPEYGRGFPLRWWSAAPEAVVQGSARAESAADFSAGLAAEDSALDRRILAASEGRVLLPMHPWQAARLTLDPAVDALFRSGQLIDHGPGGSPWFATTSLRSLYAPHARLMLKHSLSLRLTNSLRLIKPVECARGLAVDALLQGPIGAAIAARWPRFHILGEPGYLALRGADGALLPQTIVALRDNPFRGSGQRPAAVLAALCEIDPDGRGSALADTILRIAAREGGARGAETVAIDWFDRFLDAAVRPLLELQCAYGLLFGAHQQNLVIGLADGWPAEAFFRDCQGTGFVREFLPMLAEAAPGLDLGSGHLFTAAEAARIVAYYLIVNSVFAVIGAIAVAGLAREDVLIRHLRRFVEALAGTDLPDKTCLRLLLEAPTLGSKGNFMICFRNINENTDVTDPLAHHVGLPNPLAVDSAEVRP